MSDDAQLVAAALAGGPVAFGSIVDRYQDAVFGVALARLRNFHGAEDVAQQVFLEAFQRLGNLSDPSRLGAWLRSITIHRAIDRLAERLLEPGEILIELLKRALTDSNKEVRKAGVVGLMRMDVSDERKRDEFVPAVAERLADASRYVRRNTAQHLLRWGSQSGLVGSIPLESAVVPTVYSVRLDSTRLTPISVRSDSGVKIAM